MSTRFFSILKNNKGSGYPLVVVVTLILVMVFTGITEYLRLMIIAQGVRDTLQDAVIATVTENYNEVYHGVREGYSGGYQPLEEDFTQTLDYGDIYYKIDTVLGLEVENDYHIKTTKDTQEMQFRIWDLEVYIKNAPFATYDTQEERFKIESSIMLEVPVSFGGELIAPMKIKVKNSAGYTPKFWRDNGV
ncbi:MAG: hypothetical protein ACRCW1_04370 [Anaerotignaceae bacterium]